MNRKYTREHFLDVVEKCRKEIPGISITSDILIGFPGETETDFRDTLDLVKKADFDFCFVFKYSPRKNTKAFELKEEIGEEEKSMRHKKLLDMCNSNAERKNKLFIGKIVEVLIEKSYNSVDFYGKTRDNRNVKANFENNSPSVSDLAGKTAEVEITGARVHSFTGVIRKVT